MPSLKLVEVLTYSSEDSNHPVENLLKSDTYLKWKSKAGNNEKQEYAVLKLEKLSSINSIDIGNEHSAFVEVLVSREGTDFQVLLAASSFMTPLDSRNSTTINRVRMFGADKLNKNIADQKWDKIKIICTQPYNKSAQYGLTFITLHGPEIKENAPKEAKLGRFTISEGDNDDEKVSIGSFFEKRKDKDKDSPLSGAAAIRAASKVLTPESKQILKRPAEEASLSNAPENGFYQLKKKAKEESPSHRSKDVNSLPSKLENKNSPHQSSVSQQHKKKPPSKDDSLRKIIVPRKRKSRPFNQLMKDVIFIMSGYKNPKRSQLRDALVAMGAKYKSDWEHGCTHLICAFRNTPKFQEVKGKGKIVKETWIEDCFKKKIRFPWRRYNLEKNRNEEESEEEIFVDVDTEKDDKAGNNSDHLGEQMNDSEDTDDEIQRVLATNKKTLDETVNGNDSKKLSPPKETKITPKQESPPKETKITPKQEPPQDDYDADTDVDEELETIVKKDTSSLPLPALKNIFEGKTFLLYGSFKEGKRRALTRYIIAFHGDVSPYMSEKVNFVITDDTWDENFDEALNNNPNLQFVKPKWIWKCCDREKAIPPQPYLIVPSDHDA